MKMRKRIQLDNKRSGNKGGHPVKLRLPHLHRGKFQLCFSYNLIMTSKFCHTNSPKGWIFITAGQRPVEPKASIRSLPERQDFIAESVETVV
jgi:hypothetical protein